MNGQYFGDRYISSDTVESTADDANNPEVKSDLFPDKVPVDAVLVNEMPIDRTIEAIPMSAPLADEIPMVETVAVVDPMGDKIAHEASVDTSATSSMALLNREESEHFRTRWFEIQGKFVDEPRSSVQQADALVSEVIEQITQMFTKEHGLLEIQWNQGNDVSTEDLRKALQRYRSFFNRLVV